MPVPVFSVNEVLTSSAMNQVGLWKIKEQTVGSGVTTTVDVTGVFSSSFDNYLVTYSGATTGSGYVLGLRLGTTAQSGYYGTLVYGAYATSTGAYVNDNNTQLWTHIAGGTGGRVNMSATILSPFLSTDTTISAAYHDGANSGNKSGWLNNDNSYTSFQLVVNAGSSITGGTIRVYGYRN